MNIAVCDDQAEELETVTELLRQWQAQRRCPLHFRTFRSAAQLLDAARRERFTLYLLDVMMPHLDGYDLLAYLRPTGTPCIFITAKDAVAERVRGLNSGADDYIVKPFAPTELVARVESVLRRAGRSTAVYTMWEYTVDAAACHLYDGKECNASFVRSLMPGVSAVLVNLSYRTQGFYVRKSNPKHITGWEDLRRADISILNRRVGSSSRILLDTQLKKLEIPSGQLKGYDKIMSSHLTMASAIAAGDADLAIGTERITHQLEGLDFIPLLEERFDLVLQKESLENPAVVKMLAILSSPVFRREVTHFSGNDYRDLGKIIMEV